MQRDLCNAKEGDYITLDEPPDFINIKVYPDFPWDNEDTLKNNNKQRSRWLLKEAINNEGRIIIPISTSSKKYSKYEYCKVRGGGGSFFAPSRVHLVDHFPIEPGFCITIHKAQVSCGVDNN